MTATEQGPGDQSFLIGPNLYFRGIELADAKVAPAWRPSPFPISSDLAEDLMKKEIPGASKDGTFRLVACRRIDDQPVGSAEVYHGDFTGAWLSFFVDPIREDHGVIRAEMLELMVPWLLGDMDYMSVWFETPDAITEVEDVVTRLGMRRGYRLREAIWFRSERRDLICYEALNSGWVERLGPPETRDEGSVERAVRSPAPSQWTGKPGTGVTNAFAIGDRLYLRPIEEADAVEMARWSVRETETTHDQGRYIRSPISFWHNNRKLAEVDPPSWVRFAIVTLADGVVIGANGIMDIDWISRSAETETDIVRPDFRGAGYGTEAKHLLLEYAFERLGLHMVKSYCWSYNTRSAEALIKQGYRVAGGLSWTGVKHARHINDFAFDLLASEWRAHRAASR